MSSRIPRTGTAAPGTGPDGKPPFWRRRWVIIAGGILLLLLIVGALSGDPDTTEDRAAQTGEDAATSTPTPSPTPDPSEEARAEAAALVDDLRYVAAIDVLEDAGLEGAADRVRRRGTQALLRAARQALARSRYEVATANALDAGQLRRTSAVRTVLADANAGLARERAEARERRRQARIARDVRTCTSAEKGLVRSGGATPAGCDTYAAERAQRLADEETRGAGSCDSNYSGACLDPDSADYDCEGGSGDGPDYTGIVTVVGDDHYDLNADPDEDNLGCEPY